MKLKEIIRERKVARVCNSIGGGLLGFRIRLPDIRKRDPNSIRMCHPPRRVFRLGNAVEPILTLHQLHHVGQFHLFIQSLIFIWINLQFCKSPGVSKRNGHWLLEIIASRFPATIQWGFHFFNFFCSVLFSVRIAMKGPSSVTLSKKKRNKKK